MTDSAAEPRQSRMSSIYMGPNLTTRSPEHQGSFHAGSGSFGRLVNRSSFGECSESFKGSTDAAAEAGSPSLSRKRSSRWGLREVLDAGGRTSVAMINNLPGRKSHALPERRNTRLTLVPVGSMPPPPDEAWPISLEVTEEMAAAAVTVQRIYRGHYARREVHLFMNDNYTEVSIQKARAYAASRRKKQPDGTDYPLNMPLSNFSVFGEAISAYMHFVYRLMYLFLILFMLALTNIFTNIEGSDMGQAMNSFNMLSLGNANQLKVSNAIIEFVISGVLIRFLFWARDLQRQETREAREAEVTPADFSVMISGLPEDLTDASLLAEFLSSLDPEMADIITVSLSFNCRDLMLCFNDRVQLRLQEQYLQARIYLARRELYLARARLRTSPSNQQLAASRSTPNAQRAVSASAVFVTGARKQSSDSSTDPSLHASPVAQHKVHVERVRSQLAQLQIRMEAMKRKLLRFDRRVEELLKLKYSCTGFAFVTFDSEAAVNTCMEIINERQLEFDGKRLRAERPPEPEEVYWDQMQFKHGELIKRQLLGSGILMLIALLGTFVISVANYGMGPVMAGANNLFSRVLLQAGFTVMIILGNIFIFIFTPILANKIERHYTFGGKELSCYCKMFGFQVFNTVVASTVFFFFAKSSRHSWYVYGAAMIFNVLIGDLIVINIFIDLGQPGLLIARYLIAPRAHTQREQNHIYTPQADIYVAFRLQLVTKTMVICLIYSTALPLLYALASAFMWLSMWIDRYNLLRQFAPPPRSPDALIGLVLRIILPFAIFVHLMCALMFYVDELHVFLQDPQCPEHVKQGCSDVQSCQTPSSLWQAQTSVVIVAASAVVWSFFLALYVKREMTRSDEKALHVTREHNIVARYMDLITVQQPSVRHQVLPESRSTAFRGQEGMTLYVPPLPKSIIQKLRTVSADPKSYNTRFGLEEGGAKLRPSFDAGTLKGNPFDYSSLSSKSELY